MGLTYNIREQDLDGLGIVVADVDTRSTVGTTSCLLALGRASVDVKLGVTSTQQQVDGVGIVGDQELRVGHVRGSAAKGLDVVIAL